MVVPEQVEKAVKREHTQLGLFGVSRVARLTAGNTGGNDDVSENSGLGTRDSVLGARLARRSLGEGGDSVLL